MQETQVTRKQYCASLRCAPVYRSLSECISSFLKGAHSARLSGSSECERGQDLRGSTEVTLRNAFRFIYNSRNHS